MKHLNIGFDYNVSLGLQLYYVTMRDLFRWALDHGLSRYETGQLNYDSKLHFRMRLAPLDLYARHTSMSLNPLFKRALSFLQPAPHEPLIQRFPNATNFDGVCSDEGEQESGEGGDNQDQPGPAPFSRTQRAGVDPSTTRHPADA